MCSLTSLSSSPSDRLSICEIASSIISLANMCDDSSFSSSTCDWRNNWPLQATSRTKVGRRADLKVKKISINLVKK